MKNTMTLVVFSLLIIGCGNSSSNSTDETYNTKIEYKDNNNVFVITISITSVMDDNNSFMQYYIKSDTNETHIISNSSSTIGTISTTCTKGLMTGAYVSYDCNSTSYANDNYEIKSITLYDNETYSLYKAECSSFDTFDWCDNEKTYKIGTIQK